MSKFSAVLAAKRETQDYQVPDGKAPTDTSLAGDGRRRGRPNAKRSDPMFVQTTAYIRKETLRETKRALLELEDENKRDFSELVEELLSTWLKEKR